MARVKRGVTAHAKHKKVLKAAKGYYGRRKNTIRVAKQAVEKANQYAYRDRKRRKRSFRALWIQRLNAAVRPFGLNYSRFIAGSSQSGHHGRPQSPVRSCHPRTGGVRGDRRPGKIGACLTEGTRQTNRRQITVSEFSNPPSSVLRRPSSES